MSNGYTLTGSGQPVAGGVSGTVQTHDSDKVAFAAAQGGVVKFGTNTHAFTIKSADSDGKITFATDTAAMPTTLATSALTGTLPSITAHSTVGSTAGVATTTTGSGSGLIVTVVTSSATALTSVTVTTAGPGYRPGDVITVTGPGTGSANGFDSFSYTLQAGDFTAGSGATSIVASSYTGNYGPNMLKVGKNRRILKITDIACASNVLTFTHSTLATATRLETSDKVFISGIQSGVVGNTVAELNSEHTVTGSSDTTFTAAAPGGSCTDGSAAAITDTVYGDVTHIAANTGSQVVTAVPVNGINYGDTIRVGDEFRRVVDDSGRYRSGSNKDGLIFRLTSGFAVPETRDTVLGFNSMLTTFGTLATGDLTGFLPTIGSATAGTSTGETPSGGSGSGLTASVEVTDAPAITK